MAKRTRKPPVARTVESAPIAPRSARPAESTSPAPAESTSPAPAEGGFFSRDNIENLLVAVFLALLFRSFEAEAFVIPTGSMAPTLMGRHKDLRCDECGGLFQTGETEDAVPEGWGAEEAQNHLLAMRITEVTCPYCRNPQDTNSSKRRFQPYSGDRILVNKFAYDQVEPQRWDVIVFKFPGNAKQSYIKRLVGLPNETIRIRHGDVFVGPDPQSLEIARKPPQKLPHTLHIVHDSRYLSTRLKSVDWPTFWFDPEANAGESHGWTAEAEQTSFRHRPSVEGGLRWLRYRHVMPTRDDWRLLAAGRVPRDMAARRGGLISDFYAYNSWVRSNLSAPLLEPYWVGDLAVECDLQLLSDSGTMRLDLVEAGRHHLCEIDVASGDIQLLPIADDCPFEPFETGQAPPTKLLAKSPIRGRGRYQLRYANVDNQLLLWVNRQVVRWESPEGLAHHGGYQPRAPEVPRYTPEEPGDLYPVGIGAKGVEAYVHRLRVLRDTYYIAKHTPSDFRDFDRLDRENLEYSVPLQPEEISEIFRTPESWARTNLFQSRQSQTFTLGPDQFFPMGDNSPFSSDARLWSGWKPSFATGSVQVQPWVEREFLIGKAFLVYWPHGWDLGPLPLRIVPNISRMQRIH